MMFYPDEPEYDMSYDEREQRRTEQQDAEFHRELWRALIIVLRAFVKRYGFKFPTE